LSVYAIVAIIGPWVTPYNPTTELVANPYESPTWSHFLGTDNFGRDVFSRVIAGERLMVIQCVSAAAIATAVGLVLGIVAAYVGRMLDTLMMRCVELILSFPSLILSMLILAAVGTNSLLVILVVAGLFIAPITLVVRGAAQSIVNEDFVTAARLRGESRISIAVREILPNVLPTVYVEFSLHAGFAAILISGLSFLGFGPSPPSPNWGLMISEGSSYISAAPWTVLGPAIALGGLVVGLSILTEGIGKQVSEGTLFEARV
jgi:peptide/nickel transport system permease protein